MFYQKLSKSPKTSGLQLHFTFTPINARQGWHNRVIKLINKYLSDNTTTGLFMYYLSGIDRCHTMK
jgi:hypothetical protein